VEKYRRYRSLYDEYIAFRRENIRNEIAVSRKFSEMLDQFDDIKDWERYRDLRSRLDAKLRRRSDEENSRNFSIFRAFGLSGKQPMPPTEKVSEIENK
jgi:hypothetical protein